MLFQKQHIKALCSSVVECFPRLYRPLLQSQYLRTKQSLVLNMLLSLHVGSCFCVGHQWVGDCFWCRLWDSPCSKRKAPSEQRERNLGRLRKNEVSQRLPWSEIFLCRSDALASHFLFSLECLQLPWGCWGCHCATNHCPSCCNHFLLYTAWVTTSLTLDYGAELNNTRNCRGL